MAGNDLFKVFAKVVIEGDSQIASPGFGKDFRDRSSGSVGQTDYGNRLVVFLPDDDFVALRNLVEDGPHVAGKFRFGYPHCCHAFNHSGISTFSKNWLRHPSAGMGLRLAEDFPRDGVGAMPDSAISPAVVSLLSTTFGGAEAAEEGPFHLPLQPRPLRAGKSIRRESVYAGAAGNSN